MNIIAVDTSSQALLAGIKTEKYYEEKNIQNSGMQHSETIMPVLHELIEKSGLNKNEIDLFACTRGPGSFTGLRIGMSALKGMCYGLQKPLVSVSTLETFANAVSDFDGVVVPALDAKKQRYYISAFECKNGNVKRLMPDTDGLVEDLRPIIANYSNVLVVGPDREAFSEILKNEFSSKNITTVCSNEKSVISSLFTLAERNYREKGADDIGQGPVYIRKSDAEIALEERTNGKGI